MGENAVRADLLFHFYAFSLLNKHLFVKQMFPSVKQTPFCQANVFLLLNKHLFVKQMFFLLNKCFY
jgi:hypothetical protein